MIKITVCPETLKLINSFFVQINTNILKQNNMLYFLFYLEKQTQKKTQIQTRNPKYTNSHIIKVQRIPRNVWAILLKEIQYLPRRYRYIRTFIKQFVFDRKISIIRIRNGVFTKFSWTKLIRLYYWLCAKQRCSKWPFVVYAQCMKKSISFIKTCDSLWIA